MNKQQFHEVQSEKIFKLLHEANSWLPESTIKEDMRHKDEALRKASDALFDVIFHGDSIAMRLIERDGGLFHAL